MKDFTLRAFKLLCLTLKKKGYIFISFSDYFTNCDQIKFVIMRHDVDRSLKKALEIAVIESEIEIKASYYFRTIRKYFDEKVITEIGNLGHEIGYHYEDLSLTKGNYELAIKQFENNLKILRQYFPVKTICMHGNPLSRWDNRLLWKKYNYRDFAIVGEPYFDIDVNKVLYLTDTGRSWNSAGGNVRDKVNSIFKLEFRTTLDIIEAANSDKLPARLMLNVHPHRWNNNQLLWLKELIWQNTKNLVKQQIKRDNE